MRLDPPRRTFGLRNADIHEFRLSAGRGTT
jgi:hypothetical protein